MREVVVDKVRGGSVIEKHLDLKAYPMTNDIQELNVVLRQNVEVIARESGKTSREIEEDFYFVLCDEFIQKDEQFVNDRQRYVFATQSTAVRSVHHHVVHFK